MNNYKLKEDEYILSYLINYDQKKHLFKRYLTDYTGIKLKRERVLTYIGFNNVSIITRKQLLEAKKVSEKLLKPKFTALCDLCLAAVEQCKDKYRPTYVDM